VQAGIGDNTREEGQVTSEKGQVTRRKSSQADFLVQFGDFHIHKAFSQQSFPEINLNFIFSMYEEKLFYSFGILARQELR
jgi:hypothetical protein